MENAETVGQDAAAPTKPAIRPDTSKMVKTASGSYHKDDFVGSTLSGLTVAQVLVVAVLVGLEASKYAHLNPGQQRMTLGNQLRKMCAEVDETGLEGAALDKAVAANIESEIVRDLISAKAEELKAENAAAKEAADAAKAAIKAEKAAATAAKKAAKAPKVADSAEGEGSAE